MNWASELSHFYTVLDLKRMFHDGKKIVQPQCVNWVSN